MAIGAKASGKSTFNRVLCNHFHSWTSIKECQFLDIDPGQPEFSPSGHVSLVEVSGYILGPPLAHSASEQSPRYKTLRSHTIAATSFKDDPEHYRACVLDLARYLDDRYPVIVNACGWVTGIGANMIRDLVENLNISDVVLMEPLDHNLVQSLHPQNAKWSIHKISRRPPKPSARTSAEQRAMQTMAYFHSRQMDVNGSLRWSGKSINKIRSWIVSYDEPNAGILAAMSYGQQPDPEFLAEVLDGSFVTINLVEGEEENKLREVIDATPEGLPFVKPDDQGISRTLDPAHSQCVGLGLIRAIDAANKQIHLVTPLQERQIAEIMEKTVVLVRGSFDPPEWAYLEELYKSDSLSTNSSNLERPWVSRKGLVGVEGAVWRLRHPPMASAVAGSR
jgi:polynucleotide 5'-hydroxyl-kinase GRC3/NOL9